MRLPSAAALVLLLAAPAARADLGFGNITTAPPGGPIAEISMRINVPYPGLTQYQFRFRYAEISFADLTVGDIDFGGATGIDAGCAPVQTGGCDLVVSVWSNWSAPTSYTDLSNVPVTVSFAGGASQTDYVDILAHPQFLVLPDSVETPEPASLVLLGVGVLGLAGARRRISRAGAAG
jgi:hypothetical protein